MTSTGDRVSLRVDLKVSPQDTTWADLESTAKRADASEAFGALWLFDHLAPVGSGSPKALDAESTVHEGWTALAAIAALTERIRVGLLVSAVPYRAPLLLAKMAATVDHISDGRLELGLGAGNTEDEARRFGIRFGTARERLDALEETCRTLTQVLSTGMPSDSELPRLQPPPVQTRIPIVVGGKGERRTLPLIARYCDGWNYSRGTPQEFAAKRALLAHLCETQGRDPGEVACSVQVRVDHLEPAPGRELAAAYVAAGADQIALYTQAVPAAVDVLAGIAHELRGT
jgi:alkanesulfonate monooxygenase SsuD/methylene tetrahydromethanopterin reductase-like flavin-dependent oxidoreductase (luciferase family)